MLMHSQEHAFRTYYASMSDSDLLAVAANRGSFVEIAQKMLSEEMTRRGLAFPPDSGPPEPPAAGGLRQWFHLRSRSRGI